MGGFNSSVYGDKMKKVVVARRFTGARQVEVEVPDNATDEEIFKIANKSYGWEDWYTHYSDKLEIADDEWDFKE